METKCCETCGETFEIWNFAHVFRFRMLFKEHPEIRQSQWCRECQWMYVKMILEAEEKKKKKLQIKKEEVVVEFL